MLLCWRACFMDIKMMMMMVVVHGDDDEGDNAAS